MKQMLRAGLALALWAAVSSPGLAQQAGGLPSGVPQSAVVVLDRDALFAQSLFGQRVARDIESASQELAAENRRIETALETEEQELTARRETLDTDAFRTLAAEFDTRVVGIRRAQEAKARAIQQQSERAQALFFERSNPVLIQLARETGALVILDRRIVIASADQVDITDLARERIDAELGEGDAIGNAPPEPRPEPDDSAPTPDTPTAQPADGN